MNWEITPLPLHHVQVPGPEVLFQRAFFETIELVIYSYLLRSEDNTVLVDTGLPPEVSQLNASIRARKGTDSGFQDLGPRLATRLAQMGAKPTAIVLTSFGPYATGGLDELDDVPLYASKRGRADAFTPEEHAISHGLSDSFKKRLERANIFSSDREMADGLILDELGVHHPASAGLYVQTSNGKVGIVDPIFHSRNLTEGIALGAAEEAARWHRMVRHVGDRCDAVIPIHDTSPAPVAKSAWHRCFQTEG